MTKNELTRATQWMSGGQERATILADLEQSDRIAVLTEQTKTKPVIRYMIRKP